MKNIFKNIKYYLLSLKEKSLRQKLKKTTKRSFTNKTSKTILGTAADVTFNTETRKLIELVKTNVLSIAKKTDCNQDELLNYVKAADTPVYKINNAAKFLALIKEEQGLIYEQEGFNALYLSIITGRGLSLKTPPMFVLADGEIDKYYLLHHFYRWFSIKSNLPGFEYKTQKKFKKLLLDNPEQTIKKFSMEDIIALKEAIARDQEATDFVLEYTKHVQGSKNVLKKIKDDGSANI